LFEAVPARWRHPGLAFLALLLGVGAGGGAVLWWQPPPAPPPARADEHAVELVLIGVVPPGARPGAREPDVRPLRVDGALLLSGRVTSTVLEIGSLDRSLELRAPRLPLAVSPADRFQSVDLRLIVRDCQAANRWAPSDRPFTIEWRDEYGGVHLDRAGDFGRSMAVELIRYIDAVCDSPSAGPRSGS